MVEEAASYGLVKPRVAGDAITFGFKSATTAVDHYEKIRQINLGIEKEDTYCR